MILSQNVAVQIPGMAAILIPFSNLLKTKD